MSFTARRAIRSFTHEVGFPPSDVFPLLCPTREFDWIPTWECTLVHSESGYAELDVVFTTDFPDRGHEIWQCTRYEPPTRIDYLVTAPGLYTNRLQIDLAEISDGTRLTWTRTFTGLTERGNAKVQELAAAASYDDGVGAAMAQYMART